MVEIAGLIVACTFLLALELMVAVLELNEIRKALQHIVAEMEAAKHDHD